MAFWISLDVHSTQSYIYKVERRSVYLETRKHMVQRNLYNQHHTQ